MAIVYSTNDVHPHDRVSYWVEVATREYGFRSRVGPSFLGEICSGVVGQPWAGRCK